MTNFHQHLNDKFSGVLPSFDEINRAFNEMIVSVSGWRKIFSVSQDEQDRSVDISTTDAFLVAIATLSCIKSHPYTKVLVSHDARLTGPTIAHIAMRILLAHNIDVEYIGIASAPEAFAYSKKDTDSFFFYISASHNPIAHNGFKFGHDGGVFNKDISLQLIAAFRTCVMNPGNISLVQNLIKSVHIETVEAVLKKQESTKKAALESYYELLMETNGLKEGKEKFIEKVKTHPIGIVAELNGSARGVSIDSYLFSSLGIDCKMFNEIPGDVVHEIVPEGENLELCNTLLKKEHEIHKKFVLGYVPDNDGDRGNIVYTDEVSKKVKTLSAQELFALISLIELHQKKEECPNLAIVVNGPTSLLIDHICERLGVRLERTEVGEAHVVERGEEMRQEGFCVPIVGEGSNGGIISHPCKVRDPMNTLLSLVRLLTDEKLFQKVTRLHSSKPSIALAIRSLEKRTITGSFSKKAKLSIKSKDHGLLKDAYEKLFVLSYAKKKDELLERFGIASWSEEQTEGTSSHKEVGKEYRNPPYRGGLKILFHDKENRISDFMWMRGSGTENIYRIMVDAQGEDQGRHDYLLMWHHSLVQAADKEASRKSH